jgi:hypothetical protein
MVSKQHAELAHTSSPSIVKSVAAAALGVWLAMQSPDAATSFVPRVPDLTIRTRLTTEPVLPGTRVISRVQYFKGARQRQETMLDGRPAPVILITQCDERRTESYRESRRANELSQATAACS